jgi:hypothetical protein
LYQLVYLITGGIDPLERAIIHLGAGRVWNRYGFPFADTDEQIIILLSP